MLRSITPELVGKTIVKLENGIGLEKLLAQTHPGHGSEIALSDVIKGYRLMRVAMVGLAVIEEPVPRRLIEDLVHQRKIWVPHRPGIRRTSNQYVEGRGLESGMCSLSRARSVMSVADPNGHRLS